MMSFPKSKLVEGCSRDAQEPREITCHYQQADHATRVVLQRFRSAPVYEIALRRTRGCPQCGLKLLLPVICSAATLAHALSDYQCLTPWLRMSDRRQKASRVVPWFNRWFTRKMIGDFALVVVTIAGGCIPRRNTSGWAHRMYLHGILFASWHLILASDIGCCARKIVHDRMDARNGLQLFLRYHTFRIFTADIPALFCFLEAFRHATSTMFHYTFVAR
ncbi:hypothetical protein EDC04DRAFT_1199514 [Pisolithus marmoratus]|nr:hypothetical protein EDC04DRAFT_1199514 [Pisolithus marmoratus]